MIILKKTIKIIYFLFVIIFFLIAMYVLITNNNPIYYFKNMNSIEPETLVLRDSQWINDSSTLKTSDGDFIINGYSTTKGANFKNDTKLGLIVFKYDFESDVNRAKPFILWSKYVKVSQDGEVLTEGTLDKDTDSKQYSDLLNNSVSFYNKDEIVSAVAIYNYNIDGGPVVVSYGTHIIEYKI